MPTLAEMAGFLVHETKPRFFLIGQSAEPSFLPAKNQAGLLFFLKHRITELICVSGRKAWFVLGWQARG